ncbi:hypothetical protein [Bacillus pretiosus]|uniref:hypothetical protein n=1 Tax=Bacillus pretiosus TaxID=2983392 RepID=UPI002EDB558A
MGNQQKIYKKRLFLFPNVTTEGYYDPMSQSIVYCSINRNDFDNILKEPLDLKGIRKARLLVHEITHLMDHISTLHGQELLESIYNSFNAIEHGTEKDYHHMIKMNKQVRSLKFENFYKQLSGVNQIGGNEKDWEFRTSIGCRYNFNGETDKTKPIIFSQFFYRKEFIGRIPLSIESLWETSAMATEVTLHSKAMLELNDDDEQIVASHDFVKNSYNWLYNSQLLTYSTAAHLVSGLLKISDIYIGLRLSKLLSLMSLNFPEEYVPVLKRGNYFNTVDTDTKKALFGTNDPSYIFYRLVRNIQISKESVVSENEEFDIEKILHINGLPSQKQFEERVVNSMKAISDNHTNGPFSKHMKAYLELGTYHFEKFGLNAYGVSPLHLIELAKSDKLPLIFEEDDAFDDTKLQVKRYEHISNVDSRITEFISACGY